MAKGPLLQSLAGASTENARLMPPAPSRFDTVEQTCYIASRTDVRLTGEFQVVELGRREYEHVD